MKINEIITEDITEFTDEELDAIEQQARLKGEKSLSSTQRKALLQRLQTRTLSNLAANKKQVMRGMPGPPEPPDETDALMFQQELDLLAQNQEWSPSSGPEYNPDPKGQGANLGPFSSDDTDNEPTNQANIGTKVSPSPISTKRFANFNPDGTVKGTAGSRQRSKASYKKNARGSLASDYGISN